MKNILITLLAFLLAATPTSAQFTIPHTFSPGNVILSAEVNANFNVLKEALNRKGGTLTGNVTVNTDITIDGADISDFLLSTGHIRAGTAGTVAAPSFSLSTDTDTGMYFPAAGEVALSLDGIQRFLLNASGLTVYGNNILNSTGKIPGFTSTYFASLDGSAITNIPEANILDGTILARVAADETITGAWTHALGTITTDRKIAQYTATWNNAAVTFTGVDVQITNTASAAASKPFRVSIGGTERLAVNVDGVTSMTTFRMTTGATNGFVLTSDGSGNASWAALPAGSTGVPAGMVAWFESSCPSGWTRRSGAGETYENKFIRGGATYSASGGGADTHSHTVDPTNTTSTAESAGHTHTVDVANTTSTSAGDHGHTISGDSGSTNIDHTHSFTTGGPDVTTNVTAGGSSVASNNHTHSGTTDSGGGSHTHGAGTLSTNSIGAHTHDTNPASVTSSGVSATHTHDVDIASTSTTSVSNVPAYVQVVFCRKD